MASETGGRRAGKVDGAISRDLKWLIFDSLEMEIDPFPGIFSGKSSLIRDDGLEAVGVNGFELTNSSSDHQVPPLYELLGNAKDYPRKCLPQNCLPVGKSEVGIIITTYHQKCLP